MKYKLQLRYRGKAYHWKGTRAWVTDASKAKPLTMANARAAVRYLRSVPGVVVLAVPANEVRTNPKTKPAAWRHHRAEALRARRRLLKKHADDPAMIARLRRRFKAADKMRSNPSSRDEIFRADALLESFTGEKARKEFRVSQRPIKTGLVVGPMTGVMYAADRGDGVHEYCHRFKKSSRPLLIADHDGSQLGIVGGRFRFTDRGIVDT